MMSYDFRKWSAQTHAQRRKRSRLLRWALLVGVLTTLAIPVIETLRPDSDHGTAGYAGLVYPLLIAMLFSPFARAPWLMAWGRAQFDEFETAALNRATIAAYATLLIMVVAALLYMWLASMAGWRAPATPAAWAAWGFALAGLGLSLPVIYAEWMVPLPPPIGPDEDDGELL
jgi:hypothetical protein